MTLCACSICRQHNGARRGCHRRCEAEVTLTLPCGWLACREQCVWVAGRSTEGGGIASFLRRCEDSERRTATLLARLFIIYLLGVSF